GPGRPGHGDGQGRQHEATILGSSPRNLNRMPPHSPRASAVVLSASDSAETRAALRAALTGWFRIEEVGDATGFRLACGRGDLDLLVVDARLAGAELVGPSLAPPPAPVLVLADASEVGGALAGG